MTSGARSQGFTRCIKVFWRTFNFQLFHMAEIGEVQWVTLPTTSCWNARNPACDVGIYACGRSKTVTVSGLKMGSTGEETSRFCEKMDAEFHHEPYISQATPLGEEPRQDFWERINDATDGQLLPGMAASMTGLLRCRRRGHKLHTTYHDDQVGYVCRGGGASATLKSGAFQLIWQTR